MGQITNKDFYNNQDSYDKIKTIKSQSVKEMLKKDFLLKENIEHYKNAIKRTSLQLEYPMFIISISSINDIYYISKLVNEWN